MALAATIVLLAACNDDGTPAVAEPTSSTVAAASPAASSPSPTTPAPTSPRSAEPTSTDDPIGTDATTAPVDPRSSAPTTCDQTRALDQGATIAVWHSAAGVADALLTELVARFQIEHPGISVELVDAGGYIDGLDELRTAPRDRLPDLFMGSSNNARRLVDSGLFQPPAACHGGDRPSVLDDLLPLVAATYTLDGELWAFPFNVSTPALIFDRRRFELAGLDPDDPPSDTAELRAAAEQALESRAASKGLVLFAGSATWLVEQWAARTGELIVLPDNGVDDDSAVTGANFATPGAIEAARWARDMYVDGLIEWVGLNASGNDDLLQLIAEEPALMTLHTSAALGDIEALLESGQLAGLTVEGAELGAGPLPGPGRGTLAGGAAFWLLDNGDPVQAGAASLLAEWLMEPAQHAEFTGATGFAPVTAGAAAHPITAERWAEQPAMEVPYRQLEIQGDTPSEVGMQVGPRVDIQRELELAMEDIIVHGADPSVRLLEAEGVARELLTQYAAGTG